MTLSIKSCISDTTYDFTYTSMGAFVDAFLANLKIMCSYSYTLERLNVQFYKLTK